MEFRVVHGCKAWLCSLCAFDAGFVEFESFEQAFFDCRCHLCVFRFDWFSGQRGVDHANMEDCDMSVKTKVRKFLDYDGPKFDPGVDCSVDRDTGEVLPSMTKQSFKDECDINRLMAKYETTGVIDHVNRRMPEYGDFAGVVSYQDSLNIVLDAREVFAALPARLRDRFGNDPGQYLAFIDDPKNKDEAIKLGMIKAPPAEPPPQKVEVVNPAVKDTPPPQQKGA